MTRSGTQYKLFDEPVHFESGLIYQPDFITADEEEMLLEFISGQRLRRATGGKEGEYETKPALQALRLELRRHPHLSAR